MKKWKITSLVVFSGFFLCFFILAQAEKGPLHLRILATTDLHVNLVDYDYYKDAPTKEFGLARTASLIYNARQEAKNSMLFDNGDLLQGSPLGDYIAKIRGLKGETHPCYKAMNALQYDAATLGNHEFNYGLDFLMESISKASFPYVNANVYTKEGNFLVSPYKIFPKKVLDEKNQEHTLQVGVIGFVPPQILQWDRSHLEGKITTTDIMESAQKWIPIMKKQGADVVVVLAHSGIQIAPQKGNDENVVYYLPEIEGIDAIVGGHSHDPFPATAWKNKEGIDVAKGTIRGVPVVVPGYWGNHLGIIDLKLIWHEGKWKVEKQESKAFIRSIFQKEQQKVIEVAKADDLLIKRIEKEHEETIAYIRQEIGKTTKPIHSYFALVQDDPSIQIVNDAQRWYLKNAIQGTKYEKYPVLGAAAPFKCGGRNGVNYYTNIPEGGLAIKNAVDLYIYPNTLKAVLITGREVKEWLEMSAGQFRQIFPDSQEEQALVQEDFPTYSFDIIDGVQFEIDVTEPSRYNLQGHIINPNAHRIKNLSYNGKPIQPEEPFLVAANSYRADGGGYFPNLDGKNVVFHFPDEVRQILMQYIQTQKTIHPEMDNNWHFTPIKGSPQVVFFSSPQAKVFSENFKNIEFIKILENGFAKYKIGF